MPRFKSIGKIFAVFAFCFVLTGLCACNLTESSRQKELDYRDQGIALMQAAKYEEAARMFQLALDQSVGFVNDLDVDICYYKAAALYASGDTDGAAEMYTNIIDYDKDAWEAYYLRGTMYLKNGDKESAVSDYDTAVSMDSKDADLYIKIYENLEETDLNKAEEYLNKATDISSGDNCSMGYIYYLLGNTDSAVTLLEDAAGGGDARAYYYLAEIYVSSGDYDNAMAMVNKGINAESADASGTYLRYLKWIEIVCCEYLGDFDTAKSLITEYVELYPDDAPAARENTFLQTR